MGQCPLDSDRLLGITGVDSAEHLVRVRRLELVAVTAARGYGQSSVDNDLDELGVDLVATLRNGKTSQERRAIEAADDFVELVI
jgi:hypothetical protein